MTEDNKKHTMLDDKPLVTFALFAYNQEKFIREAINGVLAQNYSSLQVVFSDDCSSDNTFSIMQEVAAQYRGPHQIVLNRNPKNQGTVSHVNTVMRLCHGDFILVAAGDDISLPERTKVLVEKWIELGGGALSLHSSVMQIDANGNQLQVRKPLLPISSFEPGCIIGAAQGWSKMVFEKFDDLESGPLVEDIPIAFRSWLLDGVFYIDQPLVLYRVGGITAGHGINNTERKVKQLTRWSELYSQMLIDLKKLGGQSHPMHHILEERIQACKILVTLVSSNSSIVEIWKNRKIFKGFLRKEIFRYYFPKVISLGERIVRTWKTAVNILKKSSR